MTRQDLVNKSIDKLNTVKEALELINILEYDECIAVLTGTKNLPSEIHSALMRRGKEANGGKTTLAFAIFFGICSKQRNDKKDTQEETERRAENDTMVVVKLENIADDIKDIKRESRENREEMKQLRERVVIVEQSLKSYHKRLDGEQHSDR